MPDTSQPQADRLWPDPVDPGFLAGLRDAVATHVAPDADRVDREDVYPVAAVKALARQGYTSLTLPAAFDGQAAGFARCAAVFEEASYASAAVGISLITILQAQTIIRMFGAESLQHAVLPQFRDGLITSYALTEANHGKQPAEAPLSQSKTVSRRSRPPLPGRRPVAEAEPGQDGVLIGAGPAPAYSQARGLHRVRRGKAID